MSLRSKPPTSVVVPSSSCSCCTPLAAWSGSRRHLCRCDPNRRRESIDWNGLVLQLQAARRVVGLPPHHAQNRRVLGAPASPLISW